MHLLRWECPMSDELSETPEGATRGLLGALGFTMILLGFEALIDKTGERLILGVGLLAAGSLVFFAGVFWKRLLQQWVTTGIVQKVNNISADPMWWVAVFSVFTTFSLNQLGFVLTMAMLVPLGVVYAIYSWRKASKPTRPPGGGDTASFTGVALTDLPKQARLDLLQLFDFAVTQTTVVMLDGLIELANAPEAAESEQDWDSPQKGTDWYVGFVRQRLGDRTDRQAKFNFMLQVAAVEAERKIEAIPIDQRPDGVDPLKLRRRQIQNLQRERTVQFLRNEKREAEESLISQRTELISQLDRWQKAIGG
jgi:hypothetical protein